MNIDNSVIVVTGAAGNFGKEIVNFFRNKNATVVGLDIAAVDDEDYYVVDLCNESEVSVVIDDVIKKYKKIDVLINNAGFIYSEPLVNILNPKQSRHSFDSFKKCVDINLNSTFIIGAIVAEKMIRTRTKGLIINMSSISAKGNAGQSAYSASKAAVIALANTWSKELGVFGVRSLSVSPGFIDTNSTKIALNTSIIDHVKKNTPLRKLGNTLNVISAINYAIENDFLTGTVLEVDGGLNI